MDRLLDRTPPASTAWPRSAARTARPVSTDRDGRGFELPRSLEPNGKRIPEARSAGVAGPHSTTHEPQSPDTGSNVSGRPATAEADASWQVRSAGPTVEAATQTPEGAGATMLPPVRTDVATPTLLLPEASSPDATPDLSAMVAEAAAVPAETPPGAGPTAVSELPVLPTPGTPELPAASGPTAGSQTVDIGPRVPPAMVAVAVRAATETSDSGPADGEVASPTPAVVQSVADAAGRVSTPTPDAVDAAVPRVAASATGEADDAEAIVEEGTSASGAETPSPTPDPAFPFMQAIAPQPGAPAAPDGLPAPAPSKARTAIAAPGFSETPTIPNETAAPAHALGPSVTGTARAAGRAEPSTTPTFGDHLAQVGADVLTQAEQGADASALRVDLAPPTQHGPVGLHGTSASAAVPPPSHPVLTGVPIAAVPVEIGLKSLGGVNRFDIRLDPDDLGQIDVRLDIKDGHVRAHIVVERPEALLSLQRETSQLERALEQAGFRTGEDGVSLSLRQQGQGDTGNGRGENREAGDQSPGRERDADAAPPVQPVRRYAWGRASGVDRHI